MPTLTEAPSVELISVAVAQAAIDEALAYLDEERQGLLEIAMCIREEGGAYGYALAQIVAPYVSKETTMRLFGPFIASVWPTRK